MKQLYQSVLIQWSSYKKRLSTHVAHSYNHSDTKQRSYSFSFKWKAANMSAPLNNNKKSSNKRNRLKPFRIFNVWKRKKEKSIRFYVRTQRWSWAELQYAWCDWQAGLKLFIIQYGWLSDEAKGREREWEQKKSRWRYGAFCSALAGWKCEFFSSLLY